MNLHLIIFTLSLSFFVKVLISDTIPNDHFTCSIEGTRICYPGYTGERCDKVEVCGPMFHIIYMVRLLRFSYDVPRKCWNRKTKTCKIRFVIGLRRSIASHIVDSQTTQWYDVHDYISDIYFGIKLSTLLHNPFKFGGPAWQQKSLLTVTVEKKIELKNTTQSILDYDDPTVFYFYTKDLNLENENIIQYVERHKSASIETPGISPTVRRKNQTLLISVARTCCDNYYGSNCNITCIPKTRDYYCDVDGILHCIPGKYGRDCWRKLDCNQPQNASQARETCGEVNNQRYFEYFMRNQDKKGFEWNRIARTFRLTQWQQCAGEEDMEM